MVGTFRTEAALAAESRRRLRTALRAMDLSVHLRTEVPAPGAVPDLILFQKESRSISYVVTVEFKLSRWQAALRQAFRHRNFANEAYVAMDHARIAAALCNQAAFEKANVGLISVERGGRVHLHFRPIPRLPFSAHFSRELARQIVAPRATLPDLPFLRSIRGGASMFQLPESLTGRAT